MSTGIAPARARTRQPAAAPVRTRATETFTAPDRRERGSLRRFAWPLGIYTVPVAILVAWQVGSELGWVSEKIAPAPTAIVQAGVDLWQIGQLGPDLLISLQRVGLGLALGLAVGISTGVVAGLLRSGEYVFNGLVQIANTIPLLAILPLMIVWFGIDELTKVLLIAFGAAVPMYLNLFAAIRGVDQRLIEMAQAAGVRRWRLVTRVLVPGALPGFLVGLRFALAYSVLGLVAAETINATSGLGFLINRAQTYLRTDQVFLGLVIYAVIGLLADQLVRTLERVLLQWRPSYEAA
ncbi:ABC transporter permease [Aeromicrobium sp. NPDC092404]|uniref:ABC transporter permease n=1 Tax=Aeromicrobium sp. NPDC092404 TaxID=3154976 RepID=UPI003447F83B